MAEQTRRRILVVEDEEAVRVPLVKFLRLHGFDVSPAETVDQAVQEIRRSPPDAAIVDLRLPGGTGRDIVMSVPSPIPVIIFSAVPDMACGLERLRPSTRLVTKPFSLTMLVEMLEEMLPGTGIRPAAP